MTENEKAWIKFERETNEQLEEKGSQYRVVFLPEKDLMPYHHAGTCTALEDRIEKILEFFHPYERLKRVESMATLELDEEEAQAIAMALTVYKSVLMTVHGKRFRAPVKTVIWEDDFNEGGTGYPKCPECHELAYGIERERLDENGIGRCPFCGQRYKLDEEGKKKAEPNPVETYDCIMCGKHTMVGRRAKSNGHFHGKCTNCGCIMME